MARTIFLALALAAAAQATDRAPRRGLAEEEQEWHKNGDETKTCTWVAESFMARCGYTRGDKGVKGADGTYASDACPACIVPPTTTVYIEELGRTATYSFTGSFTTSVAIVDNPQMETLVLNTKDVYEKECPDMPVDFKIFTEEELRDKLQYDEKFLDDFDAVMLGPLYTDILGAQGKLEDIGAMGKADDDYDLDDIIPAFADAMSESGTMYASPFYGESSFVMYRKDMLDKAGLTMFDNPTWEQVSAIAQEMDSGDEDYLPTDAGICLRGMPGWSSMGATFTTMLNTYGGTWWLSDDGEIGDSQVMEPEFKKTLRDYAMLAGQRKNAAESNYLQCLQAYKNGEVAIWYDSTAAGGLLEEDGSPVQGLNGYAQAPVVETDSSAWIWVWGFAIPKGAAGADDAWKWIKWATGKEYVQLAGEASWASVPLARTSTLEDENYKAASAAFSDAMKEAFSSADPENPGVQPRPGFPGVQYVGVPEFPATGDSCTDEFSKVIAGKMDLTKALKRCDKTAKDPPK